MNPRHARLIAPLLAGAALAACAAGSDKGPAVTARTPTEQYVLEARQHPDELNLAPHPGGLSPTQKDALADLAARWTDVGAGPVVIQSPSGGDAAAEATAFAARAFLMSQGVPAERLQRVGYRPDGPAGGPVIVGFAAYEASVPHCGRSWENLTNSTSNKTGENFGCAVSANMAAQIANPADIVHPQAMDPPDAQRRAYVFDQYRQGKTTSTAQDSQAKGSTSGSGGSGGSS